MLIISSCSDDPAFHSKIKQFALKLSIEKDINLKTIFHDSKSILNYYNPKLHEELIHPHIIFLDTIESGELTSYEIGHILQLRYHYSLYILFATNFIMKGEDLLAIRPWGFLTKPLDYQQIKTSILSIYSEVTSNYSRDYLYVINKNNDRQQIILQKDIIALELVSSSNRTINIYLCNQETLTTTGRLNTFEKKLNQQFFKIYRSIIINVEHIQEFSNDEVFMAHDLRFPISKAKYSELFNHYTRFLKTSLYN